MSFHLVDIGGDLIASIAARLRVPANEKAASTNEPMANRYLKGSVTVRLHCQYSR